MGWETWLKYQHHFQNSRFLVFPDKGWVGDDWMFVAIVDRLQFNDLLQKYSDDFHTVLHLNVLDSNGLLERARDESF